MIPRPFQIEISKKGYEVLKRNLIVYLSMEERTGKTLTSILIAEKCNVERVLVITTPKGRKDPHTGEGWIKTLEEFPHEKIYTIITHGRVSVAGNNHDLVIIDEAHKYISSYPKTSVTWKAIRKATIGRPIIFLSATPYAQGLSLIYHQLALSNWSPFRNYKDFYAWFKDFGIEFKIKLHGRTINQYNNTQEDKILERIDHLFISKTRKELGFPFEPTDKLHYITLGEQATELYNKLITDKVAYVEKGNFFLKADSKLRYRSLLHMIEGGTFKLATNMLQAPIEGDWVLKTRREKIANAYIKSYYLALGNTEKIAYILKHWGDSSNIAIMYNYQGEEILLKQYFKHARILQATNSAEGIELSDIKHLIIYSQDFSTARHTQRRARQASMKRTETIVVHFLLVKKAISEQVYNTVSLNKRNFVDSHFTRTTI